ncbi:MAG: alpha-amylase family glycosyl hydrolase [Pseudomonadota bacterium]
MNRHVIVLCLVFGWISGCAGAPTQPERFIGTELPFASDAVYFVVTDRFVDGDPLNNYEAQGGEFATFDRPVAHPDGGHGNIGYLGGDFRGLADQASYIADMGFTAVWLTPVVENPDEAFSGGQALGEGFFADKGKTGYHGYWGVNFFVEDEHLVSDGFEFSDLADALHAQDLQVVLDIVCNHGSPAFSMPVDQPMFAELYDQDGTLVADHMNLSPDALRDDEPLHEFFLREEDIAQLSNLDENNPAVLDYFVRAYSHWIEQGADAFRIDTIRHMPDHFWAAFAEQIRSRYPGYFMFAESFDYEASSIARHTLPENGAIRVLDFPQQKVMRDVFGSRDAGFELMSDVLHLDDQVYQNPYELMSFYDNHDMPRLDADPQGFINANNWLFTSRGIPVVYYGSEIGFRAGRQEHAGNRDYFGTDNITVAKTSVVRERLARIAHLRQALPALQRGLQVNLLLEDHRAAFLRVLQTDEIRQMALVLLNKGDRAATFDIAVPGDPTGWRDASERDSSMTQAALSPLNAIVAPNDVRVFVFDGPIADAELLKALRRLQRTANR